MELKGSEPGLGRADLVSGRVRFTGAQPTSRNCSLLHGLLKVQVYMGSCQKQGPCLWPRMVRHQQHCATRKRPPNGPFVFTTTHTASSGSAFYWPWQRSSYWRSRGTSTRRTRTAVRRLWTSGLSMLLRCKEWNLATCP